ncbi:MAG TPA: NAD-dependent epimerase/dehydratase family protein [Gemmatimonadales bacterium]|nr:NAD-dependent epimerase/dehydratase family protein [Gemmatimonadales bacterium]
MALDVHLRRPAGAGQTDGRIADTPVRSRSLFVTGATGFIGRYLLAALEREGFDKVTWLTRRPNPRPNAPAGWTMLSGDLADPATYQAALAGCDAVVHLAAATGSASDRDLQLVNVEATRWLLDSCERQGVGRILFVSSIAADYPDLSRYPYGRSKLAAETLVRQSPLDYTILRPTIVLGRESPIWQKLRGLAMLPVMPVFGDGSARVQPISVEDVAHAMVYLLDHSRFSNEVLELGGPDVLTMLGLLRRIRKACGKSEGLALRIPARPVQFALGVLGKVAGGRLPVSPGQLVPFISDGVADPSDLATVLRPTMIPLDDLLGQLAAA